MLHVSKLSELVGRGTFEESSLKDFEEFLYRPWSKMPSEYCWNGLKEVYNPQTDRVKQERSFRYESYVCLRPFGQNYKEPTDAFMYKVNNDEGRPEIVKKFYDFLFSEDGPWRDALPGLAFVGKKKRGLPQAIIWYNTGNTDCKLTMNLLTAVRLHTCWGLDWVWDRLVEAGFDKTYALLLATNFSFNGQRITTSNGDPDKYAENPLKRLSLTKLGCSKTDMPFSTNYNPSGFKPFFDMKPSTVSGSLKDKTPQQPNNFIWHADKRQVSADDIDMGNREFRESKIVIDFKETELETVIKTGKASRDYVENVEHCLYNNKMLKV